MEDIERLSVEATLSGTPDTPGMSSSRWQAVNAGDADFFVSYLDRAAVGLREPRQQAMSALAVRAGCSVLDIGSGVGEFLIELASAFPGVRAVGIDASEALIATASARADAVGAAVTFTVGDAERLDFADASFDRINCSRVLLHLEHPLTAVREMARVLAPGGRAVIWEPDFDALMIDSNDLAIARIVRDELCAGLRNPDIGRRLQRLALDAGFDIEELAARAVPVPELRHAAQQFHLFEHLDTAVGNGSVTAKQAMQWRQELEAAAASGRAVITPVGFRVIAAKPG